MTTEKIKGKKERSTDIIQVKNWRKLPYIQGYRFEQEFKWWNNSHIIRKNSKYMKKCIEKSISQDERE